MEGVKKKIDSYRENPGSYQKIGKSKGGWLMLKYLLKRILAVIPVMLIVGIIVFFLMHLLPGNPAAMMLGPDATLEEIEALSEKLGLNRPIPVQFVEWFSNIIRGDFGTSIFFQGQPVSKVVFDHFQATLLLTLFGLFLAVSFGLVVGVVAAVFHNKLMDRVVMIITSIGVAIPNFWLGLMLALFFSIIFPVLPPAGYVPLSAGFKECFKYLILPAVAIAFGQASLLARMTRLICWKYCKMIIFEQPEQKVFRKLK